MTGAELGELIDHAHGDMTSPCAMRWSPDWTPRPQVKTT